MALRPLLLSALVGLAVLGTFRAPAAQARGYVSISVGTPAPYYGNSYGDGYGDRYGRNYRGYQRPGYALVPGYWASTYRGRLWVPARYVRVGAGYDQGHGAGYGPGYGYGPGHGYGPGYRPVPVYRQLPRGHYPPRHRRHRGW